MILLLLFLLRLPFLRKRKRKREKKRPSRAWKRKKSINIIYIQGYIVFIDFWKPISAYLSPSNPTHNLPTPTPNTFSGYILLRRSIHSSIHISVYFITDTWPSGQSSKHVRRYDDKQICFIDFSLPFLSFPRRNMKKKNEWFEWNSLSQSHIKLAAAKFHIL